MFLADLAEIDAVRVQMPVDTDNAEIPLQVLVRIVSKVSDIKNPRFDSASFHSSY
jgi:hypothetical protein